MNQVHEDQLDDNHDPVAALLREQSSRARLAPSSALRQRTVDALRGSKPETYAMPHPARRRWLSVLAAAAMLTFAVMLARIFVPAPSSTPPHADDAGPIARAPSTQPRLPRVFPETPNVRMAALTRPLEREAEALRTDLRRISSHLRSAILGQRDGQP